MNINRLIIYLFILLTIKNYIFKKLEYFDIKNINSIDNLYY